MSSSYFLKNLPSRAEMESMRGDFPMIDTGAVEVFMVLSRLSSDILHKLDEQLARSGASQAKLCVLGHLFRQPGQEGAPSSIAEAIGVTRPTITGLLDRLEREGLVHRLPHSDRDRRSLQVKLTAKGRSLVKEVMPARLRSVARLMAGLKDADRKQLLRLLAKVGRGLPALDQR